MATLADRDPQTGEWLYPVTEEEIAKQLGGEGWLLTRVGDVWHITPATKTHVVATLREAEMFCAGLDEGWGARDDLTGDGS
jgi:hypothetical protein